MIELTTGVAFLVSSLYGSGQTVNTMQAISDHSATEVKSMQSSLKNDDTRSVEAYLRDQFGNDAILVDIARCESNFHQFDKDGNIVRGVVNRADVGVMQINEKYHAVVAKKLGMDLYTVEGNVAYAKYLYAEEGTKPWSASSKCWGNLARK